MIKGRVKETSTTTGVGTLNLDGAVSGFRTFVSAFGSPALCYYVIIDGTAWEVGMGLVTSGSPSTLARTQVIESSIGGGNKLTLSAGTKIVFNDLPGDGLLGSIGVVNPLMNQMMEVWQRGTTFAAVSTTQYSADRFLYDGTLSTAVVTLNRSTNVPTVAQSGVLFNYSLEVDVTTADAAVAAGDLVFIRQTIEGYNWRHFAQRKFVLSFWVMSSKIGTHSVSFVSSASSRSWTSAYSIVTANTWEYKTILVDVSPSAGTWDYINGVGLQVNWILLAGSTFTATPDQWNSAGIGALVTQVNDLDNAANFFRLTGVKMELGSAATPLQYRSFQEELALCQRYYQKSFDYGTLPQQNSGTVGAYMFVAGKAGALAENGHSVQTAVPMRTTAPTMVFFNTSATNAQARDLTAGTDCTATAVAVNGDSSFAVTATGQAATAVGNQLVVHWTRSAEF